MDAVRFSLLKYMQRSPAHYREAVLNPTKPTAAMALGTLVHAHVLGSVRDIAVWDGARRGKAWEEFAEANSDREIVTMREVMEAERVALSVRASCEAQELFFSPGVQRERKIAWQIANRWCSGRPDAFGENWVVDLKTTTDASPAKFQHHAVRMGYAAQLAWYMDGLRAAGIAYPEQAFIVAVETKPPFVVQPYELTPDAIDLGRRTYRLWFERLRVCEDSNEWPGYVQGFAPIGAPEGTEEFAISIDGEEVEL